MLKPLILIAFLAANAGATLWARSWYKKCERLLENLSRYRSRKETTADELKFDYNQFELLRTPARILKSEIDPEIADTLDRALPRWREDGDWVLQPQSLIRLYTRQSASPKLFAAGSLILMNGSFASGEIVLAPQPSVDLFE